MHIKLLLLLFYWFKEKYKDDYIKSYYFLYEANISTHDSNDTNIPNVNNDDNNNDNNNKNTKENKKGEIFYHLKKKTNKIFIYS